MLILVALAMVISTNAGASNLSGKVTDVLDGGTITLLSLNKSIKVRLLAVAPPEKKQPYAELARKHLAELLLGKYVVVRYTGLGEGHYLNGRVLLDQVDMGAQMVRDGVAWYDVSYENDLAETERQLYAECEKAARNEKRGLWQENDPQPPWVFRKIEEQNAKAGVAPETNYKRLTVSSGGNALSSEGLLNGYSVPSIPLTRLVPTNDDGHWARVKLRSANGSIMVPADGVQSSARMPMGEDHFGDFETYMVRTNSTAYVVMSSRIPLVWNTSESALLDATMEGFIAGLRSDYKQAGANYSCEATPRKNNYDRDVYVFTFKGRQWNLTGCAIPGTVRIYTRWTDQHTREVHLFATFSFDGKEDPGARKFFQSLSIPIPD